MAEAFLYEVGGAGQSASLSSVTLSSNGTYYASASGLDGFDVVTVNVSASEPVIDLETLYVEGKLPYLSLSESFSTSLYLRYQWHLQSIDLPNYTGSLQQDFIAQNRCIEFVSMPKVTQMYSGAFQYCTNLRYVNLENCSIIASLAFSNCATLTNFAPINASAVMSGAFQNCYRLESLTFNSGCALYDNAINSCQTLSCIYFADGGVISMNALINCITLRSIYLLGSIVNRLSINAFGNTPFVSISLIGTYASLYVKSSLYSDYLSSYAGWTTTFVMSERLVSYNE